MNLLRPIAFFAVLFAAAALPAHGQDTMPADSLAYARQLTNWFYGGQADSVFAHLDPEGRQRGSVTEIQDQLAQITVRAGVETEVVEEKFVKRNGNTQYWRTAKFSEFTAEPLLFRWAFDKQGQIIGVGFGPASQAPPIDP